MNPTTDRAMSTRHLSFTARLSEGFSMRQVLVLALAVLSLAVLSGCAPGRVNLAAPGALGTRAQVWDFLERFDEYTVSYYHHVGPTAIVFDPRDDQYEVQLSGPYWSSVQTREELRELIEVMQEGYGMGSAVMVIALTPEQGRSVPAGFLYTPGRAYVRSAADDRTVIVDQVWKDMACQWQRSRVFFGGHGLCYTEENDGRRGFLFRSLD
jgi:hypothetical protein